MWSRLKIFFSVVLAVATIIVILQNTAQTEATLLWWTRTMPLAALMLMAMLVGFVLGIVVSGLIVLRRKK